MVRIENAKTPGNYQGMYQDKQSVINLDTPRTVNFTHYSWALATMHRLTKVSPGKRPLCS